MQEFKEVSRSTFELDCSPTGHSLPSHFHCDWYHEEWRVPPRYIGGASVVPSRPRLTLKSKFDYSGTWRARWGNRESTYYVGEFLCDLHMMHLERGDDPNLLSYCLDSRQCGTLASPACQQQVKCSRCVHNTLR